MRKVFVVLLAVLVALIPTMACAADGGFLSGIGDKLKGLADGFVSHIVPAAVTIGIGFAGIEYMIGGERSQQRLYHALIAGGVAAAAAVIGGGLVAAMQGR